MLPDIVLSRLVIKHLVPGKWRPSDTGLQNHPKNRELCKMVGRSFDYKDVYINPDMNVGDLGFA